MITSDKGSSASPARLVRYVTRDGAIDFRSNDEVPPVCGTLVRIGGWTYAVTAVVKYETEYKVWVRKEVLNVQGA